MRFFLPNCILGWREIYREGGFRLLFVRKGWIVLAAFFTFYLVRDGLLYLVIPFLVVRGLIACPAA